MTDVALRIMCPSLTCRKILSVPMSARGKTVRCRNCGTNIKVPQVKVPQAKSPATPPSKPETT